MKRYIVKLKENLYSRHKLLGLLFLLGITYFAFSPALDNDFVSWDDQFYVTANPLITQPSLETFQGLPSKIVSLNYHPITMMSLWANASLSGTDSARPFIYTNLIIHLLSTAVLFFLILKLSNQNWMAAFVTSSIFALNPMHVESVIWVSERKDVLYSFFFLSSLLTYCKYLDRSNTRWLIASGFLFILSCLSKAMAVSLVPCLILIDYLSHRDFKSPLLYLEKLPFLLIGILTGLVAIDVQSGGDFYGLLSTAEQSNAMQSTLGLKDRLLNAAYANYYYLKNFIFPSGFSAFHPFSAVDTISPAITGSIGLGFITLLLLSFIQHWRHIVFGLSFYLCTIALVLQFIPVGSAVVAERYTYLPYIGLAYCLGTVFHSMVKNRNGWIPYLITPILLIAFTIQTRTQSDIWQDHTTLFSQVAEKYPEDAYAREYLASGYWQNGDINSAIYHISYAINELGLIKSSAFELLANSHADKGEIKEAIAFYNEAIRLDNQNATARYHRGLVLLEINPTKAIEDFNFCENSGNTYVETLIFSPRGRAHGMLKNYQQAISDFDMAISLYPNDINSYLDRAVTYEYMGLLEHAKEDYAIVLDIEPSEPMAKDRMSQLSSFN